MKNRVVITGMGICAPNANRLQAFGEAMDKGSSGIRHFPELERLNFKCQIAGKPILKQSDIDQYFTTLEQRGLLSTGLLYGGIAGLQAWEDAGFSLADSSQTDWETGVIFGTGILGVDKFRESIYLVDAGNTRRLGSTTVPQTMASGISAFLAGKMGAGNQVSTNSSACSTGTEAVLLAYERIRSGQATRMLAGSCGDSGPYIWGGFDAMRILPTRYNEDPQRASRPFSASASGFVPGSGAGALFLETMESAQKRGATIYAEVLGGNINSGGQRNGGSMTAANNEGVRRCITEAMNNAGIKPSDIDTINGHLTATTGDAVEIRNWTEALGCRGKDFPLINSFKSLLGHGLAASGSMECVAAVLQIRKNRIFGNINAEDLHPEIEEMLGRERIPLQSIPAKINIVAKASFGFGDVNSCVIFSRYNPDS
ncbi:beta-ketoacyl-[acyl-carrier-protein] synthase family protein [Robiginitalea sp. IMCC43444]|uniref:beta-ketoacyl-[acyl-carrier-protein] synthase family protein n=1 Tax=Robiginitalea sp. IMCC43444 TaxID=3459121 RepID=UPI0040412F18